MSLYTTTIVVKPPWFKIAPMQKGWGKKPPYVIGFDSEAYRGAPMLLQFSLPDTGVDQTELVWTNSKMSMEHFLEYVGRIADEHSKERVLVYGFNLRYEYTQLFRNFPPEMWDDSNFVIHLHDTANPCQEKPDDGWLVSIDVMNDKRYCFTIRYDGSKDRRRRTVVKVIDAMAYYVTSLNKAASIVGVTGKDDYPEALKGKLAPSKALHDDRFLRYAKRDAWITRKVGEAIVKYHTDYDVPVTLSAPMFAAYVYRRRFLDGEIPLCEKNVEDAGLKSYHGGKNGYYLPHPMQYDLAYDYDLNAAYTGAMSTLPDPVNAEWEDVWSYEPDIDGIYYVTASVRSCTYRAFQEISGRWYTWREDGVLSFWITSYELDAAIAMGEVLDIYECTGFAMRGERGVGSLRRYCDEFSALKQSALDPTIRALAKLCLNSLYGKFIQKVPNLYPSVVPMFDVDVLPDGTHLVRDANLVDEGYKAGGLYHPGIASLITGKVRANIHRLEHKYQSLMTSTDGFLSLVPPDPADIGGAVGQLKVKTGRLSVWRERLYVFDTPGTHDPCDDPTCEDHPVFALHGFRAKLPVLRQVPLEPVQFEYRGKQMIGLRESKRQWDGKRYDPGTFVDLPYVLDLRVPSARSPIRPN